LYVCVCCESLKSLQTSANLSSTLLGLSNAGGGIIDNAPSLLYLAETVTEEVTGYNGTVNSVQESLGIDTPTPAPKPQVNGTVQYYLLTMNTSVQIPCNATTGPGDDPCRLLLNNQTYNPIVSNVSSAAQQSFGVGENDFQVWYARGTGAAGHAKSHATGKSPAAAYASTGTCAP
jgi:hypothetical protein